MVEARTDLTYTVLRIPTQSTRLSELVNKLRDTRLAALQAEPGGFAVKYEDEILHHASVWLRRLTGPLTEILVCVATIEPLKDGDEDEDTLLKGDWVGLATLNGPIPYSAYQLPESGQPVSERPELETRWHMCNLYTSQAHRGRGLAKRLINASIASAQEHTRNLEGGANMKARIRLFCNPSKAHVVGLYKGIGFSEAGLCTLREAFIANGDESLIPDDIGDSEESRYTWLRRYGLAMERVVDV